MYLYLLDSIDLFVCIIKTAFHMAILLSRAGGSGCAGCAAAHPIFVSFLCKDPNLESK